VLRHYLCREVAPIAMTLAASGVQLGASRRALERRARLSDLLAALLLGALRAAIALPAIAAPADQDLPPARRPRAVEQAERLDHGREQPAVFWTGRAGRAIELAVARPRGA
jgi:hypothetical protein